MKKEIMKLINENMELRDNIRELEKVIGYKDARLDTLRSVINAKQQYIKELEENYNEVDMELHNANEEIAHLSMLVKKLYQKIDLKDWLIDKISRGIKISK